ncbi:MAG: hypothetical protein DVB31_16440 [Verrucomicrobia bacterium]|nr:MAG: hypothetical protein DVB31_16440 [Verrucomicrobiota bacterium]
MAKTTNPTFPNFREAYCAYYRCRPEEFQRRAFFRAMDPFHRLLGLPIYAFNKPFFAMDFGVIDSIGDARTQSEFEFAMDELIGINNVERSIRRGVMGIRISGSRLTALWERLYPFIEPPVREVPLREAKVVPQSSIMRRPVDGVRTSGSDMGPHLVRRLRVATDAVISGIPVEQAAKDAGFAAESEFVEALRQRAESHPPSRWLLSQMQLAAHVGELEGELARTKALIADQQMALARLRPSDATRPPGAG